MEWNKVILKAGNDYGFGLIRHMQGMLIDSLCIHTKAKIVAQFHEWLAGAGAYLKENNENRNSFHNTCNNLKPSPDIDLTMSGTKLSGRSPA